MSTVPFDELVVFGTRLLESLGASSDDARYMAETAATTQAAGVVTHGIVHLVAMEGQVGEVIDPGSAPVIVNERPGSVLIDAQRCFSPIAMRLAIRCAMTKARANGIAMAAVRNTSWIAGLATYLLPVVEEGFFAQLWAQSSGCKDSAPVGGIDPRFSTNPVALAFPTADGAVLADFSTSVYSMGKASALAQSGKKVKEDVFFDSDGKLTNDPQALMDGGAMIMTGQQMNEHKGYALALWSEALTAMAGGSCNNPEVESRQSFNLTVIDPTAFGDAGEYIREMQRFVAHVKSSRRRKGVDRILLPGERYRESLAHSKQNGVEIAPALVEKLNLAAGRHGVPPLHL